MPYFSWTGVNMVGDWHKGKRFAKSTDHLDSLLFRQGIALIKNKPVRWRLFQGSIKRTDLLIFFEQLSVLINAGILVPQALSLVGDQLSNSQLQEVVHTLADAVQEGNTLSDAMAQHKKIFDSMTIQHIKIGEESGDLSMALKSLCTSLEMTQTFYNQVRSALVMPMIGVLFFMVIAGIIFVVIIPQFADLFLAARQEMPWLTRTIVSMSTSFNSRYGIAFVGIFVLCVLMIRAYTKTTLGKQQCNKVCMHIPFIGNIMRTRSLGLFFQSMSMLLAGGMRIVPALHVVCVALGNSLFADQIQSLAHAVDSGSSLSQAMTQETSGIFAPPVVAMVSVGEETGQLVPLLDKVAHNYHNEVKKQLIMCTVLLQPLLLLVLGLLVVLLVFAVYGPIVNLANGISV
jgi:type II secretory pathway component PulF